MRIGAARQRFVLAMVAFTAACGASSEPTGPVPSPTGASYTVSMTGDLRASVQGTPLALKSLTGYKEADASGQLQSTAVVLIQLTPADATQPQVLVGLMGPIQPGAYTVRSPSQAVGLGARPELYAAIVQRGSDGQRNFSATSGTVTLTAVGDTLRGTLSLHYGTVAVFPPNSNQSAPLIGANVDATGAFVVASPLTAQR